MGIIFTLINKIILAFGNTISSIIELLPNSPFVWDFTNVSNEYLKFFVWVIPIQKILTSINLWVTAVALYYVIRTILRWLKIAGS